MHQIFVTWGAAIADRCDAWQITHARDMGLMASLNSLSAEVRSKSSTIQLPLPNSAEVLELNKLKKVVDPWLKIGQGLHSVMANASGEFAARAGSELVIVQTHCHEQVKTLESFFAKRFIFMVSCALVPTIKAMGDAQVDMFAFPVVRVAGFQVAAQRLHRH
jgi:hypothetical protein